MVGPYAITFLWLAIVLKRDVEHRSPGVSNLRPIYTFRTPSVRSGTSKRMIVGAPCSNALSLRVCVVRLLLMLCTSFAAMLHVSHVPLSSASGSDQRTPETQKCKDSKGYKMVSNKIHPKKGSLQILFRRLAIVEPSEKLWPGRFPSWTSY